MSELRLTLKTITPLLMNGADGKPELRAASFRGVFRYWLRALLGAIYGEDIDKLNEAESRYFGSTKQGSALRIKLDNIKGRSESYQKDDLPQWLQYLAGRDGINAYPPDTRFDLVLSTHPLVKPQAIFDEVLLAAILLNLSCGGFGKRSRRGGGGLYLESLVADTSLKASESFQKFETVYNLRGNNQPVEWMLNHLTPFIQKAVEGITQTKQGFSAQHIPTYPVWQSEHVCVLAHQDGYSNMESAMQATWQASSAYHHQPYDIQMFEVNRRISQNKTVDRWWAWGVAGLQYPPNQRPPRGEKWRPDNRDPLYKMSGRRASAVHMQVNWVNSRFYPVVTIFRCLPDYDDRHSGEPSSWQLLNNFADRLTSNGFRQVYGDRSSWS